jgi:hypothetical protein
MHIVRKLIVVLFLSLLYILPPFQGATPHGVKLSWTAPTTIGGSGTLASYNIYRCTGTCTLTSGSFVFLTGQVSSLTTYLDPASGLTNGTTYTYAVTSVDSLGNESVYSPLFTVAFVAVTNPNPPATLTGVNQ